MYLQCIAEHCLLIPVQDAVLGCVTPDLEAVLLMVVRNVLSALCDAGLC